MNNYSRELTVIATVFANLRHQYLAVDTVEELLVVEALRRSNNTLCNASIADLGTYLQQLDDSQLRGLASNVKGIYHEILYVYRFNAEKSGLVAELQSETNHAGSDIIIRNSETGEIIREIQLKASDNFGYIMEHTLRYPGIDLLATEEVAAQSNSIESSGFFNDQLNSNIDNQFSQLSDLSIIDQAYHSAETSTLISGGLRAIEILQGKAVPSVALRKSVADIAIATSTSAFVAFLFS